jgi:hypothetical protein
MAGFVKAVQTALLDHFLTDAAYTPPATMYIALFTTLPTADDGTGGTEVTGGSYARVSTAAADWSAAVAGSAGAPSTKTNTATKTFATATANWGTVVGFGLYDASSAGNILAFGSLTTSQAVNNGNTASFGAGALILQMGDPGDTY